MNEVFFTMKRWITLLLLSGVLAGCSLPLPGPTPTPEPTATQEASPLLPTPTREPSRTPAPTDTPTPTPSRTPTVTATPTITQTPTLTLSPTFDLPDVTVHTQAHCRYGPARAFLHAGDLYPGDKGQVGGRYQNSAWLYVKFDKLNYWCWVAPSVVDVEGDITRLVYQPVRLPGPSVLYNPPEYVRAVRKGNEVTVTWPAIWMTEDDDRGYLLDVFVCQNGFYTWYPVALPNQYSTSYTFTDEAGCAGKSGGVLYAVEKHGYIFPALTIDWPAP